MEASQAPTSFPAVWANSAGSGFIRAIPTASQIGVQNGAASLADGFPPDTFIQEAAGGVPPFGADTNGILNQITAGLQWQQIGGEPVYNPTLSTDIGGYPNGAILQSADGTGFWRSSVDNNTSDPDTGGANWLPMFFSTSASVPLTNANVTLSAVQYSKPIIVLTGTLTANVALTFPALVQQWTVINATIGSYTVNALTSGGTPVSLPQGGKTELRGNGTNVVVDPLQVGTATQASEAINLGQLLSNAASNGFIEIPTIIGGVALNLIIQWGTAATNNNVTINFPQAFPNACLKVVVSEGAAGVSTWGAALPSVHATSGLTTTGFTHWALVWSGSNWGGGNLTCNWIAIGY